MNRILKTVSLGAALAMTATTALIATPAAAHGGYGGGNYGRGGYGAGAAVAAGVVGLAVGAAIADQGAYYGEPAPVGYAPYGGPGCYEAYPSYDGACYPVEDYYRMGWSWRDGHWWDRSGQRFDHPFMGRGGPGGAPRGYMGGGMHGGDMRGGGMRGGHMR